MDTEHRPAVEPSLYFGDAQTAGELEGAASNLERLVGLGLGVYTSVNKAKVEKAAGIKTVMAQPTGGANPAAGGFALDSKTVLMGVGLLVAGVLGFALLRRS